jgi:GNAT superfamily N-acetyltransferase
MSSAPRAGGADGDGARDRRPPATDELVALGVPIELRDGSRVRIRQGRATDDDLLRRGFERLSARSRYRRFLTPLSKLDKRMLRYLTDVDHHDHEAMVALDEACEEGLGVARYVRDPARRDRAEVAVTVVDDWQGRGLGTILLDVISARARREGIRTFTALVLAENHKMRDLLEELGPVRTVDQAQGTMELEVPIPDVGVAPALRGLLRIAARQDGEPAARPRGDDADVSGGGGIRTLGGP